MSLNPTPPDRLGTVKSWHCEGTRILTADGKWAGDAANESDAACLVEEHNGSVTELSQALTDLRRERQWQTISEAPKDGTAILGYWARVVPEGSDSMSVTRFCEGQWTDWGCEEDGWREPSLWQPLPAAPAGGMIL